jgi:TRAP-type C4-dicarboxylate transport system permease small subunit
MRRFIGLSSLSVSVLLLPYMASAADLMSTLILINRFLNGIIGVLITIAIIVFFWGLIRYLVDVGEKKSEGLQIMMYGLVAIFVMVSIWGLIRLLQNTFQITGQNQAIIPQGIGIAP